MRRWRRFPTIEIDPKLRSVHNDISGMGKISTKLNDFENDKLMSWHRKKCREKAEEDTVPRVKL